MEPVRYNRLTYIKTIKGIKKIKKMKEKRDTIHWRNRMMMVRESNREAIVNELKKNVHLIENDKVRERIQNLKKEE